MFLSTTCCERNISLYCFWLCITPPTYCTPKQLLGSLQQADRRVKTVTGRLAGKPIQRRVRFALNSSCSCTTFQHIASNSAITHWNISISWSNLRHAVLMLGCHHVILYQAQSNTQKKKEANQAERNLLLGSAFITSARGKAPWCPAHAWVITLTYCWVQYNTRRSDCSTVKFVFWFDFK